MMGGERPKEITAVGVVRAYVSLDVEIVVASVVAAEETVVNRGVDAVLRTVFVAVDESELAAVEEVVDEVAREALLKMRSLRRSDIMLILLSTAVMCQM